MTPETATDNIATCSQDRRLLRGDKWSDELLIECCDINIAAALKATAEKARLEERAAARLVMEIVNTQAEDEGLWFIAQFASEAYLQQELRRLHSAVELLEKGTRKETEK